MSGIKFYFLYLGYFFTWEPDGKNTCYAKHVQHSRMIVLGFFLGVCVQHNMARAKLGTSGPQNSRCTRDAWHTWLVKLAQKGQESGRWAGGSIHTFTHFPACHSNHSTKKVNKIRELTKKKSTKIFNWFEKGNKIFQVAKKGQQNIFVRQTIKLAQFLVHQVWLSPAQTPHSYEPSSVHQCGKAPP